MNVELLFIATLATYRVTLMLNSEAGPADIFARFRSYMGVKYDENSLAYGTNWFSEGILCYFCLSVWIGIAVTIWIVVLSTLDKTSIAYWTLFPFALSGGAILLRNHDTPNRNHQ